MRRLVVGGSGDADDEQDGRERSEQCVHAVLLGEWLWVRCVIAIMP
jgi:hypothetical protein